MVTLLDVSPRDGLQNEPVTLPTATKVALIQRLVDAGVRRIEAVSFVHPGRVPQMADAEDVLASLPPLDGVSLIGLVLNERGLERALRTRVDEINVVVVATDTFNLRNQGVPTRDTLASWQGMAERARAAGRRTTITIAAAFGCPFEGEVAPARVLEVAETALRASPDELAIADTIGVGVPRQVRELGDGLRSLAPDVPLRIHLHNTRNTGYANAIAAVDAGFTVLDASVGGIGGCPFAPAATGNIASEDLAYLLEREGLELDVDLGRLADTGTWIGEQLGVEAPALLGRAGPFPPV